MKARHYVRGYVQRADDGDDADGKPLTIVAATEGRKGDGLNLTMKGADLGRFQSNPVVGYGHSYWGRDGLPIGRADQTWIDGEALKMDIVFDQEDEFARKVERKYRKKMMNAFSIGFDVWNLDDSGTPEGWELFEVSAVPLPMDPNAVVESGRAVDRIVSRLDISGDIDPALLAAVLRRNAAGLDVTVDRAGAVLSKKNKALVLAARDALTELIDAAGGTDDDGDQDDDQDDDARAHDARQKRLAAAGL
ncbi:hypothetical protein [Yinghuangia sp. YIM S09857]|uniref:hypothetical protein n=1 Tax=Yinghuangia sp. YIM S09857 TaxID=3436929 RepID=UPI003F5350C4